MTAVLEGGEWSAARQGIPYLGKDPVPLLQEAGWAPGSVWTGRKISSPPGYDPGPSIPYSVDFTVLILLIVQKFTKKDISYLQVCITIK